MPCVIIQSHVCVIFAVYPHLAQYGVKCLTTSQSSWTLKFGLLCEEEQQGAVFSEVQCFTCTGSVWRSTGAAINTLSKKSPWSYGLERRQQPKPCSTRVPVKRNNLMALNYPFWGEESEWHVSQEISVLLLAQTLTRPLSQGMSIGTGILDFRMLWWLAPSQALGCWQGSQSSPLALARWVYVHVSRGKAYELCQMQRRCWVHSYEIFPVNQASFLNTKIILYFFLTPWELMFSLFSCEWKCHLLDK